MAEQQMVSWTEHHVTRWNHDRTALMGSIVFHHRAAAEDWMRGAPPGDFIATVEVTAPAPTSGSPA